MFFDLQNSVREMLNSLQPELYIQDLENDEELSERARKKIALKLRTILSQAKREQIPLGLTLAPYRTFEDAYLYRQRFIEKVCERLERERTFNLLLALMVTAMVIISAALLF